MKTGQQFPHWTRLAQVPESAHPGEPARRQPRLLRSDDGADRLPSLRGVQLLRDVVVQQARSVIRLQQVAWCIKTRSCGL